MTSAALSLLISSRGGEGKRKQQTEQEKKSEDQRKALIGGREEGADGLGRRHVGIGGKEVIGKERPNAKFVKDLEDTGDLDGM